MPRVAKPKAGAAAAVPKKKPAAKKKNDHIMPEPIPEGEIITDLSKTSWKIGPSIGMGGFGQIYSACKATDTKKKTSDYEYVVKIEPHANGTLFVEMHFYMRNARLEDITQFKKTHNLKSFGMPYLVGSGSHDINNVKHRFVVMPRYGSDIWKFFLENGRKIPEHTIYRLALQMLDVYEYIHGRTYVHADLKGGNILLGYGKGGASQAYLVDFGLASHYTQKEFKPDPKKMHNGTIEYTSRDAHLGVATMRGDFEILGYNLIDWSGVMLPWEKDNLLKVPVKVQKAKEAFMDDVTGSLKKLYSKGVPSPILDFMKYVATLEYNETPDYEKCRKMFQSGLKALKVPNSGDLDFKIKSTPNFKAKLKQPEEIPASDEDNSESDEIFEKKTPVKRKLKPEKLNLKNNKTSPEIPLSAKKRTPKESPKKRLRTSPPHRSSPRNTSISANINFSPVVSIKKNGHSSTPSSSRKPGKTIINDNLTPNAKSGKTYEFNFELDVSMDANVVVNVKRKKKAESSSLAESTSTVNGRSESPKTTVKVRRMNMGTRTAAASPR
ncbi:nucleosomal histone kinase 1 [Episyrphus balteatus]|uniref:nucleosomal histone kinase 1 n=1 Tax=Episyrphus balteatus TaxID=286459 RepID=UPI0024859C51|nr:nucleosomal histone kinase 1 [Episyrphus balteatus]